MAEGNVIIGGSSAFSWVNIDGGVFHHNLVHRPGQLGRANSQREPGQRDHRYAERPIPR